MGEQASTFRHGLVAGFGLGLVAALLGLVVVSFQFMNRRDILGMGGSTQISPSTNANTGSRLRSTDGDASALPSNPSNTSKSSSSRSGEPNKRRTVVTTAQHSLQSQEDGQGQQQQHGVAIADGILPVITVYIEPAKTRNSMWISKRIFSYSRGKYEYKSIILNNRLSRNATAFRRSTCETNPGFKVFVGHGELVLRNWPGNSIWMITGDEAGDWGLKKKNGKYFGLHGPNGIFPTDEDHPLGRIILPPHAKPWFRQYFDSRQGEAFGNDVRYIPLGSRVEYPDMVGKPLKPAPERAYTYSYMVGITDPTRARLHEVLLADQLIPKEKAFLHVSKSWHSSANHGEYVSPEKYASVMAETVFALCPKGHSVEQFRIYEAIEAGAIPVLEMAPKIRGKFPATYFDSGMLFVEKWDNIPAEMLALTKDAATLLRRQQRIQDWYKSFMAGKLIELEEALEAQQGRIEKTVCNGQFEEFPEFPNGPPQRKRANE